jgi:eukaryotic-like serine/threonine-protein kinase
MGEVYRARDERLKREVAIKVLPASYSRDADRLRRFEHEAQAAGGLNHPNITAVHDVGTAEDGSPYVVQELLEGETLRSILAGARLSTRKAIEYALQVAHGLAAAHEKGIAHRDLKPENLFVTEDGRVKILDFGLAKLIQPETASSPQTSIPTASQGTEPGVVMGTAGYMSPEQVKGLPADHRSDIFSFGAILYEMLSGRRAFKGDSAVETMSAILKEDPPELSDTNKNLSDGLERLVRHCLEKAPAQRFQSARDLAYDLEALTGVSGATASPRGLPRSGPRFNLPRLVLAGAALVAAAVSGWLLKGASQKPSSPSYRAVTFRQGFVAGARFAPDGQTIVYAASWDGGPYRIYSTQSGSTESRDLGLPSGDLLSVSSTGELAVSLGRKNIESTGTLARVPLAGGAPRVLLEDVFSADWSPDGRDLAIVRFVGGKSLLEYPMGRTLYETADGITVMRFSPKGDSIALLEENTDGFSSVCVVDLSGKAKTLTKGWPFSHGLAWSPDAGEVWFSAAPRTSSNQEEIHAVTLSGRERLVRREATPMTIGDISRDGRALVFSGQYSNGMMCLAAGETVERPISWLDSSQPDALSPDGRMLLFDEWGRGGGANGAVYLRRLDEAEAVRLTEGTGLALSADGRWVLASSREGLALLPTGPGKPRPLGAKGFQVSYWGGCLQGEKLAYFRGNESGQPQHLFQLDLSREAPPRIVSPEEVGGRGIALSPDGKLIASEGPDKRVRLYPVDGGSPRLVPGVLVHEQPVQFSTDGRSLYLYEQNDVPTKVHRVDLETGQRELWKELAPPDRTAVIRISRVVMTPDARTYAYSFARFPATLFVAEGLH